MTEETKKEIKKIKDKLNELVDCISVLNANMKIVKSGGKKIVL